MQENTQQLKQYVRRLYATDDAALQGAQEAATDEGLPGISIGPEEGRFLQLVATAIGAQRALEVGTLAGYSGIWIVRGLGQEGRLVTLESEPRHAEVARASFARAGIGDRVDVKVGPALESLARLGDVEPFDLVFLDADKSEYPAYLDWALRLTRPGSAILAHNVYMGGRVADPHSDGAVEAVREFNRRLSEEPTLESTLIPLRDGMSLSIVREEDK